MQPTVLSLIAYLKHKTGIMGYGLALLLISVGAFLGFSSLGCGEPTSPSCNSGSGYNDSNLTTSIEIDNNLTPPDLIMASMTMLNSQQTFQPGEKMNLLLKGSWEGTANGEMKWSPPFGVNVVQFTGKQPQPGGPPYEFKNVTPAQALAGIPVTYTVPPKTTNENGVVTPFEDELSVISGTGIQTATTWHYYTGSHYVQASVPPVKAASTGPVPVWRVVRYVDITAPMNQAGCQTIVTQGKSANAFMAWRVPVADQVVPNQSYTLPLVSSTTVQPRAALISNAVQVDMPLEIRIPATKWANANLPSAPGEMWLALGLDPDASITCPVMDSPTYTISSDLSFDLSGRPQACVNCTLPAYSCYKTGSAAASAVLGTALDLSGSDVPRMLLADNTTCLGPAGTTLVDTNTSPWLFDAFDAFLNLKPGDPIQMHYWIENNSATARTFNFTTTSNLPGVTWTIYPGKSSNDWEPDLAHPLTGTSVNAPGNTWFHLFIRGVTPLGTSSKQYNSAMTVTSAGAVPASLTGSTILNVSSNGQLPDPDPYPLAPDVDLSGTAAPSPVQSGQDLTYTLTIENSGAVQLTGLVLTDTLPANTTYVSCSGGDTCLRSGNTLTWNLASLDAGLTRSMFLVVHANSGLPVGTLLSNTAYSVTTGQSVSAIGPAITTHVGNSIQVYLPLVKK